MNTTAVVIALPDFVFDLQLEVQSFTVKVPGQLAVKVNGSHYKLMLNLRNMKLTSKLVKTLIQ